MNSDKFNKTNDTVALFIGTIIAMSFCYIFYQNHELLFLSIYSIISGCLGAFFIRRYGIFGKIITFLIYYPIFFIPKSVWKSIDEFEDNQK